METSYAEARADSGRQRCRRLTSPLLLLARGVLCIKSAALGSTTSRSAERTAADADVWPTYKTTARHASPSPPSPSPTVFLCQPRDSSIFTNCSPASHSIDRLLSRKSAVNVHLPRSHDDASNGTREAAGEEGRTTRVRSDVFGRASGRLGKRTSASSPVQRHTSFRGGEPCSHRGETTVQETLRVILRVETG